MLDSKKLLEISNDKNFNDFKKMKYKYGDENFNQAISLLKDLIFKPISLKDFGGNDIVYNINCINLSDEIYKTLLFSKPNNQPINIMEDEIESTLKIENVYSNRDSIKKIVAGFAPTNKDEDVIYGIKKGLDFIVNQDNKITEESLYELYMLAIDNYLDSECKLPQDSYYRNDAVFIVGDKISHQGLNHIQLNEYMKKFIAFINTSNNMNVIIKSSVIHFYFAYLHPYFDGNGRMSRLLQLWFLIQNGFTSALSFSFSQLIAATKSKYYKAFDLIEENKNTVFFIDVTPFIEYFNQNVFEKLNTQSTGLNAVELFNKELKSGIITAKEKELFAFVLSHYANNEFSTKQLEKDFKNAAYATIRSFVLKFEKINILSSQKYSNRVKYKIF